MGIVIKKIIDSNEVIASLQKLKPGQRITYYTGLTGWLERETAHLSLLRWCLDAQSSGHWIFVQRKGDIYRNTQAHLYDYIAIRRRKPVPAHVIEPQAKHKPVK